MRSLAPLPDSFYFRPAEEVARDLLGRLLVRELPEGRIVVRLVETEAYAGPHDRASHAFGGRRTARNESMYLAGGHAYVYRIYGVHFCLNVVTGPRDAGIAVLLRAAEIVEGEELVRRGRPGVIAAHRLLAGPGNLTKGLAIDLALDTVALDRGTLRLAAGKPVAESAILTGPRVGCESAGEAAAWPLRFAVDGSRAVSSPRPRLRFR
ncbi:MAG: DNA-3-methyladenine glycosylase [Thermoanaerobaculia bacterium]|nr:DNA-3-methyladenine glycosylase [Thermoanaerobaculia bacterium]